MQLEHANSAEEAQGGGSLHIFSDGSVAAKTPLECEGHEGRHDGDEINNVQQSQHVLHSLVRSIQVDNVVEEEEECEPQLDLETSAVR